MKRALLFTCILSLLLSFNIAALTIQERIDAQRAIERVYYDHRIWPKENPGSKPPMEAILPEASLRVKVEDYLRNSDALERYWQRPITEQQLQAEMDRMARETKQPSVLRELFAALNDNPELIAECLARPILADRLIHNMYAGDKRFHGALKRQVESELAITNTVEAMRALSGRYREIVWKKKEVGQAGPRQDAEGEISLDLQEWTERTGWLQERYGSLPVMKLSQLQEDADRYYVIAVLEKDDTKLRLAKVEWAKTTFEEWWNEAKLQTRAEVARPAFSYVLSEPASKTPSNVDSWSETANGPPTARNAHTAVWTGSEMIIWGGYDNGYSNTGGRYNPATNTWAADGTSTAGAPTVREYHTAVWTGSEMIVWGGMGYGDMTTGGRYNPATNTWAAGGTSTNGAPSARRSFSAVWTDGEMIIWGGYWYDGNPHWENTGGRYNPSTNKWAATSTSGAPAQCYHTAVWTGSEMIVWGGWSASGYLNTGARYNPSTNTWAGTSTNGAPDIRAWHTAIWTGNEMIVWGGSDTNTYLNTGGRYNPLSNTWAVSGTSTFGVPSARAYATAVWTGTEMIIWGGGDLSSLFRTGGRYNASTDSWAAGGTSAAIPPTARHGHSAVWTGSEMVVWGGNDEVGTLNTGGHYDPATDTWTAGGISTAGAPVDRTGHTAVWTGNEMIVWGGVHNSTALNTGGRYNPATHTWAAGGTSTSGAPTIRHLHTAVWTGTEMVVWGGYSGGGYLNTGGRYNPSMDTWAAGGTSTTNAPTARDSHTTVWTGSEMIVWGGHENGADVNTGGRYNPTANTWAAGGVNTTGAPVERTGHTAVWTGSEMIVWGGSSNGANLNTGGRYNPSTNTWAAGGINTTGAPVDRTRHTAVWTSSQMIIWGGYVGVPTNTGGLYDPSSDSWGVGGTSTTGAPTGRTSHTAVWTGSQMIVWGGMDALTSMNSGGVYTPVSCLFCDDFADGILDWSYLKPAWNETGGNLVAAPKRKAIALADTVFAGCQVCSVEAEMQTVGGIGNKMWLLGWYQDKNNTMELLIKEENDKIILRQRAGGRIVKKVAAAHITINPNISYRFKVAFDGTQFDVSMDGNHLIALTPAGTVPTGTVGFAVKNTIGTFGSITVQ